MRISKSKLKWIYKLDRTVTFKIDNPNGASFFNEFATLTPSGLLSIKKGFAWDGCTPKFNVFQIVIGTPDGIPHETDSLPLAYWASAIHDVLYQFAPRDKFSRKQADLEFYNRLKVRNFKLAKVYYKVVRVFGFYWWNKYTKDAE